MGSSIKWRETAAPVASARICRANGKQQPRAFDQHRRMQHVLRKILEPEHASIENLSGENDLLLGHRLGVELQFHLEIVGRQIAGIDIDRDVDVGLRLLPRERLRRVGILEAQILEILAENPHRGLGARLRRRRADGGASGVGRAGQSGCPRSSSLGPPLVAFRAPGGAGLWGLCHFFLPCLVVRAR